VFVLLGIISVFVLAVVVLEIGRRRNAAAKPPGKDEPWSGAA